MNYVLNDPADFADEATEGFVAANRDLVRRVPGGVARRFVTPDNQVAVVIGGGSGHYPAFAGLVGQGLAHGAALGNVFASPSTQQVYNVAKSVTTGAGVLLSYGNYAGDVLNFDAAEERLNAEGIPCRTVTVTDDIASAPTAERARRRGIAGDLTVFRAASWAAEQGFDIDRVHEIAARANEHTRSLGVAFSGCTLPGADAPLFTVPDGQMAIGMGIHGEPGIEMRPLPTANELANLFVEALLAERPDAIPTADGARVAVVLNGLGSVKSEELFVIYASVAEQLEAAGLVIVEPEVGEFATSFEMAGVSLTLFWLDEELERAWVSPSYTPAYRKGTLDAPTGEAYVDDIDEAAKSAEPASVPEASAESVAVAATMLAAVEAIRDVVDREADELGRLDAVAGDGDHGIGMQRGTVAAALAAKKATDQSAGAGTVLTRAGEAWADKAGGTSGALWGAALVAAGTRLGDEVRPDRYAVAEAVGAARDAILKAGGAEVGDKTLVDALIPFAASLSSGVADGSSLAEAWTTAADAASVAAEATADLTARRGRARTHTDKSVGTPDPGAISLAHAMTAVAAVLGENN